MHLLSSSLPEAAISDQFLKIFTESDMQPNGAFELLDMFNGALAKLWMIDIVIDIKFTVLFSFAVFLLA